MIRLMTKSCNTLSIYQMNNDGCSLASFKGACGASQSTSQATTGKRLER